ncbi:MAG: HAD-IA family hydrolase [Myxococcota bacterium]
MTPAALIFDFDGTLVDSMPVHFKCWQTVLAPVGLTFDEPTFYAWGGVSTREIVARLAKAQGVAVDVESIIARKEVLAIEHAHEATLIEEVVSIARDHRGRLPMAVATGGTRAVVEPRLASTGMASWFDAVVTADDVKRCKPDPETFLLAAERLGVDPAACRAYEDAEAGLASARAAGMDVIDVRTLRS